MNLRATAALLVLSLSACASEEPAPAPPPPAPTPRMYVGGNAAAPQAERRRAGTVQFVIKDGDLSSDVLPLFEQQVGVSIRWIGDPRKVSLRLTQPMPWEDALDLVCQFTKTHPTRDYQGRLILKDGWGGSLGSGEMADIDPNARKRPGRYGGAGGGSSSGAGSAGGSSAGAPPPAQQGSSVDGAMRKIDGKLDNRVNSGH